MKKCWFLLVVSSLIGSGCSSVFVQQDYDKDTDFSRLKTYGWKHAEQPKVGHPQVDNDLFDERIRHAVDATLQEKGFQLADQADADCLVAYFIDYKQRIGGSSISLGIGAGRRGYYGGTGYNTHIRDYEEGVLTIDILDATSQKTIWRGIGTRTTYSSSTPSKITRIVNEAVAEILEKFPPES
jgi:hypothetical protein